MRFARIVFITAGVYGLLTIAPQYFMEAQINRDNPPAITHPEYFYGFLGVTLAWQVMFLLIGADPVRFRPAMLVGVIEKLTFAIAAPVLVAMGRATPVLAVFGGIDALLMILFLVAWFKTPRQAA